MVPQWQQTFIDKAPSWEGNTSWLILDTHVPPLPTVGIGCQVPLAEALTLPWQVSGVTVPPSIVSAAYARVSAMPGGRVASYYRYPGCMELDLPARLALFQRRVDDGYAQLLVLLPSFDTYPDAAKTALLNLIFNLGPGGLTHYVQLLRCVVRRDWLGAAAQSGVNTQQPAFAERNAWCAGLFRQAAAQDLDRQEVGA